MQRKKRRRTALILLAVTTLLNGNVGAWAHSPGPTGSPIPDPANGRIHSCYQNILPIPRFVRLVTPGEPCLLSLAPVGIPTTIPFEDGVDWPSNGVLTGLSESPPVPVLLEGFFGFGFAVISCAPKQAIGVLYSSPPNAGVFLIGSTRGGTPAGTELTAKFFNLSPTAHTIQPRALCVTSFTQ